MVKELEINFAQRLTMFFGFLVTSEKKEKEKSKKKLQQLHTSEGDTGRIGKQQRSHGGRRLLDN